MPAMLVFRVILEPTVRPEILVVGHTSPTFEPNSIPEERTVVQSVIHRQELFRLESQHADAIRNNQLFFLCCASSLACKLSAAETNPC